MNKTHGSSMTSSIFIGRWTTKILFSLRDRPYRHGQLRRQLGSVSERMLTRTLCHLESAGFIARRVAQSKAITVEVFVDQAGKDDHRSTGRNVPVGQAILEAGVVELRGAETGLSTKSLAWDVPFRSEISKQKGQP